MNYITHNDFGLFENEQLSVDFISFNIQQIDLNQKSQLASYLQDLGFNCYQKQLESSKSTQDINGNNSLDNQFEVYFIVKIPYQKEINQLQFPGISGKQFYQLVKQKTIQWQKFPKPRFSRLDLVYQRTSKSKDPISNTDFINASYIQFQHLHPFKSLLSRRNHKGLLLKIGNRRSSRHYRIYTSQMNNDLLRFEAEMKGNLIKDFQDLLVTPYFDEHQFERKLAYQFFKYSFELFRLLNKPYHVDWLMIRIRPYQYRNTVSLDSGTSIPFHYLNQMDFKLVKEKKHLITLLRLLNYVRKLSYNTKTLTSKYRRYKFPIRDFLKYNQCTPNHYQVQKLKSFFDLVKQNFVIESFSDQHYRMLVTIPEVLVFKSEQNILMVDIWIAEELFDYLYPFLFSDLFQQKLNNHQFQVLFEVIKTFSSKDIRKEFNIQAFIDNYPASLNNKQKKQIKESFIHYLKILQYESKLRTQVIDLSSNNILHINDLDSSFSRIAVFENIHFQFIS